MSVGNVYYKDSVTGQTTGKYSSAVPGAMSYGFATIGATLKTRNAWGGDIIVASVLPGSDLQGLVSLGDCLVAVNGEPVEDLSLTLVHALIGGKAGTKVLFNLPASIPRRPLTAGR